jgi:hypothetical protein
MAIGDLVPRARFLPTPCPRGALAHRELFLAIQPVELLPVDPDLSALQKQVKAAVTDINMAFSSLYAKVAKLFISATSKTDLFSMKCH